jgi:hypothetical protein
MEPDEWKTNPDILVMQLEALITPDFNLETAQEVATLIDERLYILGIRPPSLTPDGKPREDFFKMWTSIAEKYTTEPLKAGGTVFSVPILVQKPPIEPDANGRYPTIAAPDIIGFISAMSLQAIPELYFIKMTHKNEGDDDHSTGMIK